MAWSHPPVDKQTWETGQATGLVDCLDTPNETKMACLHRPESEVLLRTPQRNNIQDLPTQSERQTTPRLHQDNDWIQTPTKHHTSPDTVCWEHLENGETRQDKLHQWGARQQQQKQHTIETGWPTRYTGSPPSAYLDKYRATRRHNARNNTAHCHQWQSLRSSRI